MADIINLNKARKARKKDADRKQAETNRATFGTSSKLRQANKAREELALTRLEAHRLDPESSAPEAHGSDPSRTVE